METLVRIAEGLGRFSARFVPSAFAIAVLLTLLTMGLALGWAGAPPQQGARRLGRRLLGAAHLLHADGRW